MSLLHKIKKGNTLARRGIKIKGEDQTDRGNDELCLCSICPAKREAAKHIPTWKPYLLYLLAHVRAATCLVLPLFSLFPLSSLMSSMLRKLVWRDKSHHQQVSLRNTRSLDTQNQAAISVQQYSSSDSDLSRPHFGLNQLTREWSVNHLSGETMTRTYHVHVKRTNHLVLCKEVHLMTQDR